MGWKTVAKNTFPNAGSYPDPLFTYSGVQTGVWSAPGDVHFSFPKPSSGLPGSTFTQPLDGSQGRANCFLEIGLKTLNLTSGIDDDMSIALYRSPQGQPDPSNTGTIFDQFLFDFELNGLFQQV